MTRNCHVSIEEGIWNWAGAGARAFFIRLGGRFNTVEAELSLPCLVLLVHQQTTHLPYTVRRGPDRCFHIFRHPCKIAPFDSHFKNPIKNAVARVHLIPWSLERSPEKVQALSGSLAAHSSRSFDRCLLHWRPPCSALGRFLGRLYSTYSSRTPLVPSGPVMVLLSAVGYRQISTVTRFQAYPSGLLHWARGPYSRAAGGSLLLTGAVLKARSAGGVSGSFGRSVVKPKLFVAGLFFVSSPTLLHKFQVISKLPNFRRNTTIFNSCPPKLQRRSINRFPLV